MTTHRKRGPKPLSVCRKGLHPMTPENRRTKRIRLVDGTTSLQSNGCLPCSEIAAAANRRARTPEAKLVRLRTSRIDWTRLSLKLHLLRVSVGMTQGDLAAASGIGDKSISSFEADNRITAIRLFQLDAIVEACGMTLSEFLEWDPEEEAAADNVTEFRGRDDYYPTPQSSLGQEAILRIGGRR